MAVVGRPLRWIDNLSLLSKLALLMAGGLLLTGYIGWFGVRQLKALDAGISRFTRTHLPALEHILAAERSLQAALSIRVGAEGQGEASAAPDAGRFDDLIGQAKAELQAAGELLQAEGGMPAAEQAIAAALADVDGWARGASGFEGIRRDLQRATGALLAEGRAVRRLSADSYRNGQRHLLWVLVVGLAGGVAYTILVGRSILVPVRLATRVAEGMAAGDLTEREDLGDRKDEPGRMLSALGRATLALRQVVQRARETASAVVDSSRDLAGTSSRVQAATDQVVEAMQQLARGAEEQAKATAQARGIIEAMLAELARIGMGSEGLAADVQRLSSRAESGGASVDETIEHMGRIQQAVQEAAQLAGTLDRRSREIGRITETISAIADETNLLTLNAAIEAARAGEQGRGFAVVAEQVRQLAEASREASGRIGELVRQVRAEVEAVLRQVQSVVERVSGGSQALARSGESFRAILQSLVDISDRFLEINGAIQAVARRGAGVGEATRQIAAVSEASAAGVQEVLAGVQEAKAGMDRLKAASESLAAMARRLQEAVDAFTTDKPVAPTGRYMG